MSKILTGVVKSDKMINTAVVVVKHTKTHPKYKKIIKVHKSFLAHNDKKAKVGDTVQIEETRPMGHNKHFKIINIVKA